MSPHERRHRRTVAVVQNTRSTRSRSRSRNRDRHRGRSRSRSAAMRTSRTSRPYAIGGGCRRQDAQVAPSRTSRPYGGDCRRQDAQAEVPPDTPDAPMIDDVKLNKQKQEAARRKVELRERIDKTKLDIVDKAKLDKA